MIKTIFIYVFYDIKVFRYW